MDLTPSGQDLITATFTAFLAVIGWLISAQIKTNKALSQTITDAILEFRLAIQLYDQREQNQKKSCAFHQAQTLEIKKHVDSELRKIHHEIEIIKNRKP